MSLQKGQTIYKGRNWLIFPIVQVKYQVLGNVFEGIFSDSFLPGLGASDSVMVSKLD